MFTNHFKLLQLRNVKTVYFILSFSPLTSGQFFFRLPNEALLNLFSNDLKQPIFVSIDTYVAIPTTLVAYDVLTYYSVLLLNEQMRQYLLIDNRGLTVPRLFTVEEGKFKMVRDLTIPVAIVTGRSYRLVSYSTEQQSAFIIGYSTDPGTSRIKSVYSLEVKLDGRDKDEVSQYYDNLEEASPLFIAMISSFVLLVKKVKSSKLSQIGKITFARILCCPLASNLMKPGYTEVALAGEDMYTRTVSLEFFSGSHTVYLLTNDGELHSFSDNDIDSKFNSAYGACTGSQDNANVFSDKYQQSSTDRSAYSDCGPGPSGVVTLSDEYAVSPRRRIIMTQSKLLTSFLIDKSLRKLHWKYMVCVLIDSIILVKINTEDTANWVISSKIDTKIDDIATNVYAIDSISSSLIITSLINNANQVTRVNFEQCGLLNCHQCEFLGKHLSCLWSTDKCILSTSINNSGSRCLKIKSFQPNIIVADATQLELTVEWYADHDATILFEDLEINKTKVFIGNRLSSTSNQAVWTSKTQMSIPVFFLGSKISPYQVSIRLEIAQSTWSKGFIYGESSELISVIDAWVTPDYIFPQISPLLSIKFSINSMTSSDLVSINNNKCVFSKVVLGTESTQYECVLKPITEFSEKLQELSLTLTVQGSTYTLSRKNLLKLKPIPQILSFKPPVTFSLAQQNIEFNGTSMKSFYKPKLGLILVETSTNLESTDCRIKSPRIISCQHTILPNELNVRSGQSIAAQITLESHSASIPKNLVSKNDLQLNFIAIPRIVRVTFSSMQQLVHFEVSDYHKDYQTQIKLCDNTSIIQCIDLQVTMSDDNTYSSKITCKAESSIDEIKNFKAIMIIGKWKTESDIGIQSEFLRALLVYGLPTTAILIIIIVIILGITNTTFHRYKPRTKAKAGPAHFPGKSPFEKDSVDSFFGADGFAALRSVEASENSPASPSKPAKVTPITGILRDARIQGAPRTVEFATPGPIAKNSKKKRLPKMKIAHKSQRKS